MWSKDTYYPKTDEIMNLKVHSSAIERDGEGAGMEEAQ